MHVAPETAQAGRTHALQYRFTAHLRDPDNRPAPEGIEDRRMAIYRELSFNNIESFAATNFPVLRSLYAEADWNALIRDFFREHLCHTPLFPEFAREFIAWLEQRQLDQRGDAPFLLELAHYEWAELALSLDEHDIADVPHDADGDPVTGVPVLSPLLCVLAYRFPVQRISPDFRPDIAPEQPTVLLLVRGRDDEVRFHEINPLTAALIEGLQENSRHTGLECVEALLAGRDPAERAPMREAGIQLLTGLKVREAILGTRTT
jgi:hypothetical protein